MAYTNLTDAQARTLQAAIVPLHDVVKEQAILNAVDLILGMVGTDTSALREEINTYTTTLVTKLNTDATAQNALAAFPLTMDTDYAASDL